MLELQERGDPRIVPLGTESLFIEQPLFAAAAAAGILRVRALAGGTLLEPRNWVGTLRVPGKLIRVAPRFPDWYRHARSLASSYTGKPLEASGNPQAGAERTMSDAAKAFVASLSSAVDEGLPILYVREEKLTARPRGRLLISTSIRRLWSKGLAHKAICAVQEKRADDDLGCALATAARLVVEARELSPQEERLLDSLSLIVDGTPTSIDLALLAVTECSRRYADLPAIQRLLQITEYVLRRERSVPDWETTTSDSEARFVDVDQIWERALCAQFQLNTPSPDATVALHPLRAGGTTLLVGGGPAIDPDVVLYAGGAPRVIVDAKNSLASAPGADDVYQVLCYASRLKARAAVLIYLADASWTSILGKSEDGITIAAAGVSVSAPGPGLAAAAQLVKELW